MSQLSRNVVSAALGLIVGGTIIGTSQYLGEKEKIRRQFLDKKKRVVVVGAGYAGRAFVRDINTDIFDVVVIDKNLKIETDTYFKETVNKVVFAPQPNYIDSLDERAVVTNYMVLNKEIKSVKGECVDITKEGNALLLRDKTVVPYDYLVMATGSDPDTFNVKMNYDCSNRMWYYFKEIEDVKALATAIDLVGLDDIVVMGGGITGVELASEIGKKIDEKRKQTNVVTDKPNVTILEPSERILPKLKESTSALITNHLLQQKVRIITNANIQEINAGTIKLLHNGTPMSLKAVIAIWTCGVKPDEFALQLLGSNEVTGNLQLILKDKEGDRLGNIYSIGDCNNLLPKSAQHSKQQGRYLAAHFNDMLLVKPEGKQREETRPFKFESQGQMIRLSREVFMDSPVYTGMLPLWVHRTIIGLDL